MAVWKELNVLPSGGSEVFEMSIPYGHAREPDRQEKRMGLVGFGRGITLTLVLLLTGCTSAKYVTPGAGVGHAQLALGSG